jgi:hypothetical protein
MRAHQAPHVRTCQHIGHGRAGRVDRCGLWRLVHHFGRLWRLVLRLHLHGFGLVHHGRRIRHHGRHIFRHILKPAGFAPVRQSVARVSRSAGAMVVCSACSQQSRAPIRLDAIPRHQGPPLSLTP